ncbi:MAG: addiction module antidote protein, HigA family [Desulfobacterales bacterium]|nr:MAG: addiction module antidote protein, HigA family [Desulfobacterales bacterium]
MEVKNEFSKHRKNRKSPIHPGEILREEFLPDYGLSMAKLASFLGVSKQTVNELLSERRAVTPNMALRLSRLFGNSPDFWLNLQRAVDLWQTEITTKEEILGIQTLQPA